MTSDEQEGAAEADAVEEAAEAASMEPFTGLADLDEDLRTMSQNSTEVERWRRLSTRGLTPATGTERDSSSRGLAPPIVEDQVTTAEMDAHAVATAPGTIAAPVGAMASPPRSAPSDPESTAQLRAVTPEVLAELEKRSSAPTARKSFAPPKDSPSAPPGSRVVLPREATEGLAGSRPSSRPPLKFPRPSQPPAPQDEVRGWRASDPAHTESDEMPAAIVIPPPARLPSMGGPASTPSSDSAPGPAVVPTSVRPPASPGASAHRGGEGDVELDGRLLGLGLLAAVVALFGLYYVLFL